MAYYGQLEMVNLRKEGPFICICNLCNFPMTAEDEAIYSKFDP